MTTSVPLRFLKNRRSKSSLRSRRTPPVTSTLWLSGSLFKSRREPKAPRFWSKHPKTSLLMRASTMAPAHMMHAKQQREEVLNICSRAQMSTTWEITVRAGGPCYFGRGQSPGPAAVLSQMSAGPRRSDRQYNRHSPDYWQAVPSLVTSSRYPPTD
jgi:hypothetical protein